MNFSIFNMKLSPQVAHRLGPKGTLTPLRCGFQYFEKGHIDKNFLIHEYAMVYVLSGKGYYQDDIYGRISVEPGVFIQRVPGVMHSTFIGGPRACFYLAVPGETYELFKLTDAIAKEYPVIHAGLHQSIVNDYLQMINDMKHKREEEMMSVLIDAQNCLLKFHQILKKQLRPSNVQVQKAVSILSDKLSHKLKLPELAEKLNMSYPNFRNKFIETMGIPPGDFRIKKKIEKAREFLLEGSNVKEAAAKLGYPDAYSFSRQFKKVTGISPSEYIKLSAKGG